MTEDTKVQVVCEAVGVFSDTNSLEETMTELQSAGIEHAEIGLLAGEHTVRQSLGHLYTDINKDSDEPNAPETAFVLKESIGDAAHAFIGAFYFTGATVAAGAIVATAGALGTALVAALAGVAAFAGIDVALAAVIDRSEVEHLREQVDRGHLLLFVRILDADRKAKVIKILSNRSIFKPCTIEVPNS